MGEMTFIKNGIATTIHDNGDISSSVAERCDGCHRESDGVDGLQVRDMSGELLLWLCRECK